MISHTNNIRLEEAPDNQKWEAIGSITQFSAKAKGSRGDKHLGTLQSDLERDLGHMSRGVAVGRVTD